MTGAAQQARWKEANPEKVRLSSREYQRRLTERRLGLEPGDYERMLAEQEGVCAICRKAEVQMYRGEPKRLAIDHDHTTGAVRALLCSNCNRGLGHFQENPELLMAAVAYLMQHSLVGSR